MKHIISLLVALSMLAAALPCAAEDVDDDIAMAVFDSGAVGGGDFSDYTIVEGRQVFFEDFEAETPDDAYLPSNEFSIKQDSRGSRALYISGLGKNVATKNFGPDMTNYLVEADVMLAGCNAGTNGGFFISARKTSNTSPAYNMLYTDVNNYDWNTKTWNSSTVARDRMIIARSRGSFNIATSWFWTGMSGTNGVLDLQSRSFAEYVHMKMYMTDTFMRIEMHTSDGELISTVTQSLDEVDTIAGDGTQMARIEHGNIQLGAHASCVWYDNISVREISVIKSAHIKTEAEIMLTGTEYDIWAESELGVKIPFDMLRWEYDEDKLELADGKIRAKEAGSFDIRAVYDGGAAQMSVRTVDEYNFDDFEIIIPKTSVFSGEKMNISVRGSCEGSEYTVSERLVCSSSAGVYDGSVLTAQNAGRHDINVTYNGKTKTVPLYVSSYKGAQIKAEKTEINLGESCGFSVWADTDNSAVKLTPEQYSITADDGLEIYGESVRTVRSGKRGLYAVVDSVRIEAQMNIAQLTEGVVVEEDFEDDRFSEFFTVPAKNLATEADGNRVYCLCDEFSPFFGDTAWRNYKISGRVKLINKRIEDNRYNTSFGIYLRQNLPEDSEMTGGHKGIPAVYCIDKDMQYLRIGTQSGAGFAADEGVWYDFCAESFDNQFIFELGDRKICFSVPISENGGFYLNAENTELYIDDIKIERMDAKKAFEPVAIEAVNSGVRVDEYANRQLTSLIAVRAVGADGSYKYVSTEAEYEVLSDNAEITSDSLALRIKPNTSELVQIGISCNGLSTTAQITPVSNYDSRTQYLRATQNIRNKNFCYKLLRSAELLGVLNTSNKAFLSYVTGLLALQPKRRSYDRELGWFVDLGKYESSRGIVSDADFVINILLVLRYELKGILNASEEAWARVDELIKHEYYGSSATGISENHRLMNFADAYLVSELFPDDVLYGGKTGRQTNAEYARYIIDWMNYRYKYGMMEYDSTYVGIDIIALETLYNYSENESMRRACRDFLNWLYADSVQDAMNDRLTGAHGRTYFNTSVLAKFYPLAQRFENEGEKWTESVGSYGVQPAVFSYLTAQLHDVVYEIAENRSGYVNKERHKVYQIPDDEAVEESLCKYTYITDDYSLGCIVNYENPFPKLTYKGEKYYNDNETWVAGGHQELSMTAVYRGNDKRFLTFGQPGKLGPSDTSSSHNYYSGFINYPAFNYMQYKNTIIGLYYIADDTQLQYVHCFMPKAQFERTDEENGWIFLLADDVYTAIRPLKAGRMDAPAYRWGDEVKFTGNNILLSENEILIEDKYAGFVMQVSSKTESGMDFEEFKTAVLNTKIEYSLEANGTLSYTTYAGDTLTAVYDSGENSLNGVREDYSAWKLFDSEYMQADYGEGYTTISAGNAQLSIMPARLMNAQEEIQELNAEIADIETQLAHMKYVPERKRLDELRIDLLAEKIMYVTNEYTAQILWQKLIDAVQKASARYDFDKEQTLARLEKYKQVEYHGAYAAKLAAALENAD